jgi:kynurenine formamidase
MIIIENLCNLDKCPKGLLDFACLPLKFENSDGAPLRAVAWV